MSHLRRSNPVMTHDKYIKLISNSRFKPGALCWARRDPQRIWPAVITDPSEADLQRYPLVGHHASIFVHFQVADYHAFVPETEIWDYLTGVNLFFKARTAKTEAHTQAVNHFKRVSDLPAGDACGSISKQPLKESNELQEKDETDEMVDIYEFNEEDDFNEKSDEIIYSPGHQRFSQVGRKTNFSVQEIPVDQLCLLEPKVVLQRKIFLEQIVTASFKSTEMEDDANVEDHKTDRDLDKAVSENESADPMKIVVEKIKKTRGKRKAKEIHVTTKDEKLVKKRKIEKDCCETWERGGGSFGKSLSGRVIHKQEPCQASNSKRKLQVCSDNESKEMEECARRNARIGEENSVNLLHPEDVFFSFREATLNEKRNTRHSPHVTLKNMPKIVIDKFRALRQTRAVFDTKIGFVGMGSLGKRLAHQLLTSGHKVFFWNRSPWKCYNLINHASSLMKRSPEELVNECDIIFICLADINAVKNILHKYPGFLASIKDKGVVNFTTMDLRSHLYVKQVIETYGGAYLHVSLSQSDANIDSNNYLAVVSGNHTLLSNALTCLGSFAKGIFYIDSLEHSANIGVYLKVFNASFNVLCSGVFTLMKEKCVLPANLRRIYNTYHLFTDISPMPKQDMQNYCLSNHLSPKIVSQSMASLIAQVKQIDSVPMLGILDEMYNVKNER